tara:strand:- start:670 stop:1707 length:1038 start_codon:yes stop_codon:yes gene_type:complete
LIEEMNHAQPTVSVLLPAYDAVDTLEEAITSILNQTHEALELIAVDDGSTDGTGALLDHLSGLDGRIKPFHIDHAGLIEALNTGIDACSTSYIARFDADDRAHPERLEKQVDFLDANRDITAVASQIRCFPDDQVAEGFRVYESWINSLITPDEIAREIYIESPLVHPTVTIRRESLVDIGGYQDHGWPEDYDLWLRLHTAGHRFAKIPEVLHEWREGDSRLTRTDSRYSVENFIRAKVNYMMEGPLKGRELIIWGAGQMGRRISKHLVRSDARIVAFVDIDEKKVGNTRRGSPIISLDDLPDVFASAQDPCVLASVPSRGARSLIRENLNYLGWVEGREYICVA